MGREGIYNITNAEIAASNFKASAGHKDLSERYGTIMYGNGKLSLI